MEKNNNEVLPRFGSIIKDLISDLINTFPEFSDKFDLYQQEDFASTSLDNVYQHASKVFPERFFDILYQNADIFKDDTNTEFLPGIDFKIFFNCEDVSEDTKKTLWKYLQLMLFIVIENVQDKSMFGEASNLFQGVNEEELQSKLSETINGLGDLFKNIGKMSESMGKSQEDESSEDTDEKDKKPKEGFGGMPNLKNIQEKLNKLFEGKIGALAKEMAEELTNDFTDVFGEDMESKHANPQEIMKELMKDPKKLMDLMKKVSGKLNAKMESGEISKEELMKEAGDILGNMGAGEGGEDFNEMLKKMARSMGGNLGKNVKIDTNKIDNMTKKESMKTAVMKQHEAKKKKMAQEAQLRQMQMQEQIRIQESIRQEYIQQNGGDESLVFHIPGENGHERSFIHPDLMKEIEEEEQKEQKNKKGKKKKKKAKK